MVNRIREQVHDFQRSLNAWNYATTLAANKTVKVKERKGEFGWWTGNTKPAF